MEPRRRAFFKHPFALMTFIVLTSFAVSLLPMFGQGGRAPWDIISIAAVSASVPTLGIFLIAIAMRRNRRDLLSRELEKALKNLAEAEKIERNRMARELHDGVCQMLLATRCWFELANEQRCKSQDEFARYFDSGLRQLEHAIDETRRVSHNLKPALLNRYAFTEAIELVSREFGQRTKTEVSVHGAKVTTNLRVPPVAQAALLRTVQEALANVEKHAAGSRVVLKLHEDSDSLSLTIVDDGCGLDPVTACQSSKGIGLRNMRERVAEVGGTLTFHPTRSGTKIVAKIPLALRGNGPGRFVPQSTLSVS